MAYVYREYSRKILFNYMNLIGCSFQTAIKKANDDGFYTEWDEERIKNAFKFGNGTFSDFKNYMDENIWFSAYRKVRK